MRYSATASRPEDKPETRRGFTDTNKSQRKVISYRFQKYIKVTSRILSSAYRRNYFEAEQKKLNIK